MPWTLEVRMGGGEAAVRDGKVCGAVGARRVTFEAGIDSVMDAIAAAGRAP